MENDNKSICYCLVAFLQVISLHIVCFCISENSPQIENNINWHQNCLKIKLVKKKKKTFKCDLLHEA